VANTISACVNLALLTHGLRKKLSRLGLEAVKKTLLVLVPNAIFAGVIAWALYRAWEYRFGHHGIGVQLGAVFVPGGLACLIYWLIALWAKVPAAHDILGQVATLVKRVK
jgi:peptidoglycan biosynthesis protein MviN/MurJ (putative lipid II flippase)